MTSTLLLALLAAGAGCNASDDVEDAADGLGDEMVSLQPADGSKPTPLPTSTTTVPPTIPIKLGPDIRVTRIDATLVDPATDKYKVVVTVTNGLAGSSLYNPYPGGGELYLRAVNSEHYPAFDEHGNPIFLEPQVDIARLAIPVIPGGGTWRSTHYYHGRTTYVGTLRPVPAPPDWPAPPPLPETNPANNEKTLSMLCETNVTFTSAMLAAEFQELSDIDAHLTFTKAKNPDLAQYEDGGETHFIIPGLFSETFELNEIHVLTIGNLDYYLLPRHMQSVSSTLALGNGTLDVCIDFETGGPEEIYCAVDGGPDSNCPNANATQLQICLDIPLGFDASSRYITVGTPEVKVNANWDITIGLDYDVSELVNAELEAELEEYLVDEDLPSKLSRSLTLFFHDYMLSDEHGNHGEITDFQAGDGAILIAGKSASGVLSYCAQ